MSRISAADGSKNKEIFIMKKRLLFAALFSVSALVCGEEVIAHWDFSKGSIDSTNGLYKGALKGFTELTGEKGSQVLSVGLSEKGEGILLKEKYPALTPKGAFRIEAKVILRDPTARMPKLIIWDSNYIQTLNSDRFKGDPKANSGFAFYISRNSQEELRPYAFLGHGGCLELVSGESFTAEEGVPFTVAFEYDGVREFAFYCNGELNRKGIAEIGGPLAPACHPVVIGDRGVSNYCRFDGFLAEIKLIDLGSQKK